MASNNETEQPDEASTSNGRVNNNIQPSPIVKLPQLPELSKDDIWLDIVDELFNNSPNVAGITQNQKFLCVFQKLTPDLQKEFRQLLINNDDPAKYDTLRDELRKRFKIPGYVKYDLIQPVGMLGTRTPSEFLRLTIRELKEMGIDEEAAIRTAFVKGLPDNLKDVATVANYATVEDLSHRLDEIVHTRHTNAKPTINSTTIQSDNDTFYKLNESINALTEKVSKLSILQKNQINPEQETGAKRTNKNTPRQVAYNNHATNRNDNKYQDKNNRTPQYYCLPLPTESKPYGLCYFHRRYGGKAYKCAETCRWNSFIIHPHGCEPSKCKWTEFLSSQKN